MFAVYHVDIFVDAASALCDAPRDAADDQKLNVFYHLNQIELLVTPYRMKSTVWLVRESTRRRPVTQ
jgi:hypothetical protein